MIPENNCLSIQKIKWKAGRHPILEQALKDQGKQIKPLDIELNRENRILLVSGPNAGGKSVCLKTIGMLPEDGMDKQNRQVVAAGQEEMTLQQSNEVSNNQFPPESSLCKKCSTKAMIRMDGCLTCLNCGYSKCS